MTKMKVRDVFGRWGTGWGLLLGLLLAGCGTPSAEEKFADPPAGTTPGISGVPDVSPPTNPEHGTKLLPGDSLTVTFSDLPPPQPSPYEVKIQDDGTITLLHNEAFTASDKTPGDLEKEIRRRYVPRLYPTMTVTVNTTVSTRFYYVDGEVMRRDRQVYISRVTVLKAIASAGGFTDFANRKKLKLTRVTGRAFIIHCNKAIDDSKLDMEVFPGDRIYVQRKPW
jgi:protein involved in polysaccharide export with SLBB domain